MIHFGIRFTKTADLLIFNSMFHLVDITLSTRWPGVPVAYTKQINKPFPTLLNGSKCGLKVYMDTQQHSFGNLTCVLGPAVWRLFLVIQLPVVSVPHSEGITEKRQLAALIQESSFPPKLFDKKVTAVNQSGQGENAKAVNPFY